ncbi:MAG: hypothetical protein EBZ77_05675, partial [Chitinophagia bacterium]|nr:hypothetical protein [Chitinophagia bacterium]
NVYVSLKGDHRIRKIDTTGRIYTIAGTGSCCSDTLSGGPATAEDLDELYGLGVDTVGNVYFPHLSAYGDSRIRRINATGGAFPSVSPISGANTVIVGNTITLADTTASGTWRSANTSLATVNSTGVVTGVAAGLVNIRYIVSNSCGSVAASKTVSVTCPLPTAATITGSSVIGISDSTALTASVAGGVWSSVSPSIASINSRGVVTGRATGIDTIKYTLTNSCGSQVTRYLLTVVTNNVQMCTGSSRTFTGTPSGGTWSSSYGPVASVTATGVVYASRTGTILLTYVAGSTVTAWRVTVISPTITGIGGVTSVCPRASATFTNITAGGMWSHSNTACGTISPVTGVYAASSSCLLYTSDAADDHGNRSTHRKFHLWCCQLGMRWQECYLHQFHHWWCMVVHRYYPCSRYFSSKPIGNHYRKGSWPRYT